METTRTAPVEWHVIVEGLVQGVGFRASVCRYAQQHQITGTVRNLDNGNVELIIQGNQAVLESWMAQLHRNTYPARIVNVSTTSRAIKTFFNEFTIIH